MATSNLGFPNLTEKTVLIMLRGKGLDAPFCLENLRLLEIGGRVFLCGIQPEVKELGKFSGKETYIAWDAVDGIVAFDEMPPDLYGN